MDDASRPKTQREIERELEAELSYTRRVLEDASRMLNQQLIAANDMQPQDGVAYLPREREQAELAYASYQEALRKFTEFAARRIVPSSTDQPAGEGSNTSFSEAASK